VVVRCLETFEEQLGNLELVLDVCCGQKGHGVANDIALDTNEIEGGRDAPIRIHRSRFTRPVRKKDERIIEWRWRIVRVIIRHKPLPSTKDVPRHASGGPK
jgi:hypothetical protein